MRTQTILSPSLLIAAASAQPLLNLPPQSCNAIQIFIARGSMEPYPGTQIAVVQNACSRLSSCGYTDITYPATFSDYCNSVESGRVNAIAQLTAYAAACPDAKLVLTGWSQGGQVVGDVLGGGGGVLQSPTETTPCLQNYSEGLSMTERPGNRIAAAVIFGDVRHVANQTYTVGGGAGYDGEFPRNSTQLASLNRFAGVIRSWCHADDQVCTNQGSLVNHLTYTLDSGDAADFIVAQVQ